MPRNLRIGLIAAAVVAAFGITYLAFAPGPGATSNQRLSGPAVPGGPSSAVGTPARAPAETESPVEDTAPPVAGPQPAPESEPQTATASEVAGERPTAADFTPQPGVNHWQRGRQLFWKRDYAAAAGELERAVRQRPGTYYPHYLLGLCYHRLGDPAGAEREYIAAREVNGKRPEALVNLARLYLDLDEVEEAMELAVHATEVAPEYDPAWNLKGRAHLELDERQEAIAAFQEACRLDPENAYAWNNLGFAHILGAEFEDARAPLETAVSLADDVAYMHNNLGVVRERLGELEAAERSFARAAELDAGHPTAAASAARLAAILAARADRLARTGGSPAQPAPDTGMVTEVAAGEEPAAASASSEVAR